MNQQEIQNQIEKILKSDFQDLNKKEALQLILSVLDLTTLEGKDTQSKIIEMCNQAQSYAKLGLPNVAAVCFYPNFASIAKETLKQSNINVACVAGAFPSGQSPLSVRLQEVSYAIEQGADEIDMVISRGKFLEGDDDFVAKEISEHKKVCGKIHLKVILETGELETLENIKHASKIAIENGADFIKTSTGKISPAATFEAFYVMCVVIKEHFEKTGAMIGIKAAGGISEPEQALKYLLILEKILGKKWMNKNYFRIGASRLANKLAEYLQN